MLRKLTHYFLLSFLLLQSCKTRQPVISEKPTEVLRSMEPQDLPVYRATTTTLFDLVHTSLKVSFDWNKKYLFGKAEITLHPHFYPTNILILNARGMQINEVGLLKSSNKKTLEYQYQNDSLIITLDRIYQRNEELKIFIDYVAKPEELDSVGGSAAITSDKGLYFINAEGKDKFKPRQIWTQGETQSNSVWFPTIDVPNQNMTQDIAINVDSSLVTLSNGLLQKSVINTDGTRTDYWSQSLPHAPYLVMMMIGHFAIVKDSWRGKEVSYYVDPEYKNDARKIFGNTPEMIEFFSNILQVPYAWEKYAQVVAHDYVSGAMENTSATLHGEFIQQHERELLDDKQEAFISHELFHQWFGNMVTCESWSNLPLNESFASYGEYLWNEFKYGRAEADNSLQNDMASYLRESKSKQVDMIRFNYEDRDDMFDRHSYEKGECIMHMLRKYTGDEAFFSSLKLYLERNKFKPVEIHQLRLAFEETTGEDFNWFFNQWFFSAGHPDLDFSYQWNEDTKIETVTIKQLQNLNKTPLYRIPLDIDIYTNGAVKRHRVVLDKEEQTFTFSASSKPMVVNTDAEKMLLCIKKDHHTEDEWIALHNHSKSFIDKKEALQYLSKDVVPGSKGANILITALDDAFWGLRQYAINNIRPFAESDDKEKVRSKLIYIIQNDKVATVRNTALKSLIKYFPSEGDSTILRMAINDSSYTVAFVALKEFTKNNKAEGLMIAKSMENISIKSLREKLSTFYAEFGSDEQAIFMGEAMQRANGFNRYGIVETYSKFLKRCNNIQVIKTGLGYINNQAVNDGVWYIRLAAVQAMKNLGSYFNEQSAADNSFAPLKGIIDQYLNDIKLNDKDERVRSVISKI